MKILILFALVAATLALPTPDNVLTREQLDSKARDVQDLLTVINIVKCIVLAPKDDEDWEQPGSDLRDIEAFLTIIDLLKNVVLSKEGVWQINGEEHDAEEILDILNHLKNWVLATGAKIEQLNIQGHDKKMYIAILSLIEHIEQFVSKNATDREAFLTVLEWLRNKMLSTGGDVKQLDFNELDKNANEAIFEVLSVINRFSRLFNN